MPDIKMIADRADMIVNGYAFERKTDGPGHVYYLGKSQQEWILWEVIPINANELFL